MTSVAVSGFDSWRDHARRLLAGDVPPEQVVWVDEAARQTLLPMAMPTEPAVAVPAGAQTDDAAGTAAFRVPRTFVELARTVALHRDEGRWQRLYRVLWRVRHEGASLLDVSTDTDVHALERMAAQVRRDEHKMRAFVRFTAVEDPEGTRYVSWYQPDHHILREAAPFFADRFASMRWSILTPELSAHWDTGRLTFTPGVPAPEAVGDGDVESLWRTYYQAVFNPARVNLAATMREMPLRRWARLPEASLIPSLVAAAHETTQALARKASDADSARPFVPDSRDLTVLKQAAGGCRGCALHARATQVVFGEGPPAAGLVLVGEQPGDSEDLQGHPFVGPAGGVLDRALGEAGIDRAAIYLTNAVKHFSFEERGKRRIHKTPRVSEMRACRPWLEAELQAIRPSCIVCLGSTAARTMLGPQARVTQLRGSVIADTAWAPAVVVTVHPSAVLRADDGEGYFAMLVEDLRRARGALR